MNLDDLIQPQTLKLTYVTARPYSTLESLIYEVVSYSFCEAKNPERWTAAFPGRLYQRVGRNTQEAKAISNQLVTCCVSMFGDSLVNRQCLLSDEAKPVLTVKSLKNFPSSTMWLFVPRHQLCLTSFPFFGRRKEKERSIFKASWCIEPSYRVQ